MNAKAYTILNLHYQNLKPENDTLISLYLKTTKPQPASTTNMRIQYEKYKKKLGKRPWNLSQQYLIFSLHDRL